EALHVALGEPGACTAPGRPGRHLAGRAALAAALLVPHGPAAGSEQDDVRAGVRRGVRGRVSAGDGGCGCREDSGDAVEDQRGRGWGRPLPALLRGRARGAGLPPEDVRGLVDAEDGPGGRGTDAKLRSSAQWPGRAGPPGAAVL
ncbi:MAG: hypothetical protein AVDCRST_MAG22-1004, partial [uncultured Rubrobacteraceae bacterium]